VARREPEILGRRDPGARESLELLVSGHARYSR
jgi:hypothetical protein